VRSHIELWRCHTYTSKEPETLDWIDRFTPGEVLFDIGANIGLYSLYAAKRGVRVYSFEPEAQNYAGLVRNCIENQLNNLTPYCTALSDRQRFDLLYVTSAVPGDSQHNLGEQNPVFQRECVGTEGIFATTLDRLCFDHGFPVPRYIKVDVDGLEERIVEGATQVLGDARFRSLLIEVAGRDGQQAGLMSKLAALGLRPVGKAAREYREGSLWARNYIFEREGV
jgi:FkbM family methyltransferase